MPAKPTLPKFPGAIPGRHLGRNTPTRAMRMRVVPLAPYVVRMGATPPPDAVDYTAKAARTLATMLGNDQFGDCTIAATLHQEGAQTAHQPGGAERVPSEQEATSQYFAICGPGDQGCFILDVLDHQRDKGMTCGGKTIKSDGYVSCTLGDQLLAKVATYLFGGLHLGVNLPRDWYQNAEAGFVWDVTTTDVIGGHSVAVVGYDTRGLKVSTWGKVGTLTWAAFSDRRWVEEVYATLSPDWYSASGLDAHGISVDALRAALDVVKGGGTPPVPDPGPTPTPPAPVPPDPNVIWDFVRTFDVFGFTVGLELRLSRSGARSAGAATWFTLLADAWALVSAIRVGDWSTALVKAEALVADLVSIFSAQGHDALAKFFRGVGDGLRRNSLAANGST